MAVTGYPYTKSGVDIDALVYEINANVTIVTALDRVEFNAPDDLNVYFADALSGGEETALDSLVSSHTGTALNDYKIWCNVENQWFNMKAPSTPSACPNGHSDVEDMTNEATSAFDAQKIKGKVVDDTDIANGKVLAYNSSSGNLEYEEQTGGSGDSGWHGSETRIKILPRDFMANDDSDGPCVWDDSNNGIQTTSTGDEIFAFVPIPTGYKATHVRVYASSTVTVEVYEQDITGSSQTSKGSGNTSAEIDITDVNSTTTNYLVIMVDPNSTSVYVYGGYVTIAAI